MSLIAGFGSAALDALAREAAAAGEAVSGEAVVGRGGERTFAVDAVPMQSVASEPLVVLALHDVTTLRRVERVRRDFVANISHELRTPLASIKLLAETLSAGAVDDLATARDFTLQIERETDHLAQLVDELLDLFDDRIGRDRPHDRGARPGRGGRRRPRADRAGCAATWHPRRSERRRPGRALISAPRPTRRASVRRSSTSPTTR